MIFLTISLGLYPLKFFVCIGKWDGILVNNFIAEKGFDKILLEPPEVTDGALYFELPLGGIIWLPRLHLGYLVHETNHAAAHASRLIGDEDDEFTAYVQQFIYENAVTGYKQAKKLAKEQKRNKPSANETQSE